MSVPVISASLVPALVMWPFSDRQDYSGSSTDSDRSYKDRIVSFDASTQWTCEPVYL